MPASSKKQSVTLESLDKKIDALGISTDKKIDALALATKINFNKVNEGIEDLARITKQQLDQLYKRFDEVNRRFDDVDKRFGAVDDELRFVRSSLHLIEYEIRDMKGGLVKRNEFEDAMERLDIVEQKLGIGHK